jgi:hypothetical protein
MDEEILLTVRFSAQVACDDTAMLCSADNLGAAMYSTVIKESILLSGTVVVRVADFLLTPEIFPFSQFSSTGKCVLAIEVALNNV